MIHDKIILFDAALLVKKTRCGRVTLNEVLNNYGLTIFLLLIKKRQRQPKARQKRGMKKTITKPKGCCFP